MTSLIENFIFKMAGINPQRPPPINPARNIRGTMIGHGRCGPQFSPTQVPKMAPISSWLSAPIFQNLARKATARPPPIKIRGIALVTVSLMPYRLPKDPMKILAMANSGLTPENKKITLMARSPAASENTSERNECLGRMSIRSVTFNFSMVALQHQRARGAMNRPSSARYRLNAGRHCSGSP